MKIEKISLNNEFFETTAELQNYVPNSNETLPVLIFIPGGSYTHIDFDQADKNARFFSIQGFHCFVLRYSFIDEKSPLLPAPIIELGLAIKLFHQNADQFQINAAQIVVMGFSVGGHIAALYNDYWSTDWLSDRTHANTATLKPSLVVLGYPVIDPTLGFPRDQATINQWTDNTLFAAAQANVNSKNVPTFIWVTDDDNFVPSINALEYSLSLNRNGISQEFHNFHHGPHGLNLASKITARDTEHYLPHVANWTTLVLEWIHDKL